MFKRKSKPDSSKAKKVAASVATVGAVAGLGVLISKLVKKLKRK